MNGIIFDLLTIKYKHMKKISITFLTACIGGAVAIGAYKLIETKQHNNLSLEDKQKIYFTNNPHQSIASSTGDLDFTQAAAAVTPAVVHIKTTYTSSNNTERDPFDGMFEEFFGGRRRQLSPVMASGSGVIISDDGYIVTNNHVVENADKIEVILPDKRSFLAKVIGKDANTDLALVKIQGKGFPIVKLGNSDDTRVGEWVLAVGYPFALNTTVTAGIISAKGRQIGILDQNKNSRSNGESQVRTAIESFIQTDAAINRGNSGGALVNTRGELIGINAAIASQSGSYEGYGFAIPINLAKKILDDFMKFGLVKRGYIGVSFRELDSDVAKQLGVDEINGLYVDQIMSGGAAESAGLKKGDIIIKVDGNRISSSSDLQERVGRLRPGDKIELSYLRGGKERSTNVTLKGEESVKIAKNGSQSSAEVFNKLGASFAPLSNTAKKKFGINAGIQLAEVRNGGLFEQYNVPKGLIITNINGKEVNSVEDIDDALDASSNNMIRISGITYDGSRLTMSFPIR